MRRLLAATSVVLSVAAFACSSAPPDEDQGEVGSAQTWTGAQCKNIRTGYRACLRDSDDQYRDCVESAQKELIGGVLADTAGLVTAGAPCMSASLTTLLDSRCVFTSGDAAGLLSCVGSGALAILGHIEQYKGFTRCASELGENPEVLTEYTRGFEKNVAAFLAVEAARVSRYVLLYDQCATKYASDGDACEPVACNQAKCTCFDTPSCPTIARCGGKTTHMTGIVDCGSIANGKATTNEGDSISCVSYTNQATAGCHGKATAGACK